jgi:D-3-phosphoglycerate dehydrogenase
MEFVVVGDYFMSGPIFQEHLEATLRSIDRDLEIRTLEWEFDLKSGPLESDPSIHEYAGSDQALMAAIKNADVLLVHLAPVSSSVIEAGKKLNIIGCARGGPVNINVKAATKRRIPVLFTPGRNADAVADYTLGMILAETRNIARGDASLKQGIWRADFYKYDLSGPELSGKTLGLVGIGSVGTKVCARAKAFGMRVLAYDPYVPEEKTQSMGAEAVDLGTLLKQSDFVSIHAPLTSETKGLIGSKELSQMKRTAYLINTSRGKLVNENALVEALVEKKIAGAALDVFESEPLDPKSPLLRLSNVTITPHIAGASKDVAHRAAQMLADDVLRILLKQKPLFCANPTVFS